MDRGAIENLAQRWMREYGRQAAWHLRRKIENLRAWGDDDGARIHQQVLFYCEDRRPAISRPARLMAHMSRVAGLFRHTLGVQS
jgi:hypothetical protein